MKLQSRELNLVQRKTAIIVRQVQNGRFRKSAFRISKPFGEIMKGHSKIIVQVIFDINGAFNNSREPKNKFLESSYKAVTESCAEENHHDRQTGTVSSWVNSIKVQSGFQSFSRNHAR